MPLKLPLTVSPPKKLTGDGQNCYSNGSYRQMGFYQKNEPTNPQSVWMPQVKRKGEKKMYLDATACLQAGSSPAAPPRTGGGGGCGAGTRGDRPAPPSATPLAGPASASGHDRGPNRPFKHFCTFPTTCAGFSFLGNREIEDLSKKADINAVLAADEIPARLPGG